MNKNLKPYPDVPGKKDEPELVRRTSSFTKPSKAYNGNLDYRVRCTSINNKIK
jgi:hypothetical protein